MHRPGELFIGADGYTHQLKSVWPGFTPADSECEDYQAVCGYESQSWSGMGVFGAQFVLNLKEALLKNARICPECLPGAEEGDDIQLSHP
jgi:hypothetical protein